MSNKPWYHKGLRFACTQCGNCCRRHGERAFVYLVRHDLEAIPAYLGIRREAFLEAYCEDEAGRVTLKTQAPECPFLTEDSRCRIYPVRPKQCATWPFWEENLEREAWEGPVRECCPGIGAGKLHSAAEVERIAAETERWYEADEEGED
jgi:hypothetical protein